MADISNRERKRSVMQLGSAINEYVDESGTIVKVSHKTTLWSDGTFDYQVRANGKLMYSAFMDRYLSLETAMQTFASHFFGYQTSHFIKTTFRSRISLESMLSDYTEVK